MTQSRSAGHDGGFVDGHSVFGVVGHNGVARFVVGGDGLVLLVDFHTPALRAWSLLEGRVNGRQGGRAKYRLGGNQTRG